LRPARSSTILLSDRRKLGADDAGAIHAGILLDLDPDRLAGAGLRMLAALIKLENWAKLAGFVLIFLSIIVCSFIYAISYSPLPGDGPLAEHANPHVQQQSADEEERLQKAANKRGLTIATWVLAFATGFLFIAAAVQAGLFVWQLDLIRKSLADTKKGCGCC
jgi:hypothetical protein